MKGHKNDLPTMRLRCAGYNLLSKLREAPREIEKDIKKIRQTEKDKTNHVFRWRRGYADAWRLTVK